MLHLNTSTYVILYSLFNLKGAFIFLQNAKHLCRLYSAQSMVKRLIIINVTIFNFARHIVLKVHLKYSIV